MFHNLLYLSPSLWITPSCNCWRVSSPGACRDLC